jgi:hypothetical protein
MLLLLLSLILQISREHAQLRPLNMPQTGSVAVQGSPPSLDAQPPNDATNRDKGSGQNSNKPDNTLKVELSVTDKPSHGFWKDLAETPGMFPLAGSILAAVVSILCFIWLPIQQKLIETRLAFVEKQLHELYGPLLAECIHSDSIFRKTELVLSRKACVPPDVMSITTQSIKSVRRKLATAGSDPRQPPDLAENELSVWALLDTFLNSNKKRFDLLRRNLHFVGPYPPQSLFTFMIHTTQIEALLDLKEHTHVEVPSGKDRGKRTVDPYAIYPFPIIMTAEIIGKVAFLKALQREYQFALGTLIKRQVFYRKPYFLTLQLPLYTKAPCTCEECKTRIKALSEQTYLDSKAPKQRDLRAVLNVAVGYPRYNALTFPLIWGPYTAVELLEIRANLIVQENSFRDMALKEHTTVLNAFLNAAVLRVAKPKYKVRNLWRKLVQKNESFALPIDYRMAQPFDSIDASGSKSMEFDQTHPLEDAGNPFSSMQYPSKETEFLGISDPARSSNHRANFFFYQQSGKRHITLMRDLTEHRNFAYKSTFDKLQS